MQKIITKDSTFDFVSNMICLKKPGSDELQILKFGDSGTDSIFFSEHMYFYFDSADGMLEARTELFDFSNFGDFVLESLESLTITGTGFIIQSLPNSKSPFTSRVEYMKVGENELKVTGKKAEGDVAWSEEYDFKRREV